MVAFGNYDAVKQSLQQTRGDYQGIKSYALYWVLSVADYYAYTADASVLTGTNYTEAVSQLQAAFSAASGSPTGQNYSGWDERMGTGFFFPDVPEAQKWYRMMTIRALREYARALSFSNPSDPNITTFRANADALIASLRASAGWYTGFGLHANGQAMAGGFTSAAEQAAIMKQEFSDRVNRISLDPLHEYDVLKGLAVAGRQADGVSSILDYYGSYRSYGGTMSPEIFHMAWVDAVGTNDPVPNSANGYTSLAHAWGAGAAKWLHEEILGIKPTSPGFATFSVRPNFGSYVSRVAGQLPLVNGARIKASFNGETGNHFVAVPANAVANVSIPAYHDIASLTVNGVVAFKEGAFTPGYAGVASDNGYVTFNNLKTGDYWFSATYSSTTLPASYTPPAVNYPVARPVVDRTTQGNWLGKYGADGYWMPGYNGTDKAATKLPSYISSLNFSNNFGQNQWAGGSSDLRALNDPNGAGNPRNIGAIYSYGWAVLCGSCFPTMSIDISANGSQPATYKMALYVIDWDSGGRAESLDVFDLNTLKRLTRTEVVKSFVGGAYLVYTVDRSVRIRIDHLRGSNIVISGIFFDH